jgi:hypothetical protein
MKKHDAFSRVLACGMLFAGLLVVTDSTFAGDKNKPKPDPVTVVNTPLPVTGSLGVSGTVQVRDVDSPGRAPYGALMDVINGTASCVAEGGGFQGCTFTGFPVVPAGKRLVMIDFSGQARAPTGCKIASISLRGSNLVFTFAVPHQNPAIPEVADFHETILNFVDAGQAPIIDMDASCSGLSITSQTVTVTGYLIALP